MNQPTTLNPRIIEGLYCEALVLADEVRSAFDMSGQLDRAAEDSDLARLALSCEALRTTTRMMHALAWLLNHRAHFAGELSEFQLRRYGKLTDYPDADPERVEMLRPEVRELIGATERFHARLMRLDRGWREPPRGGAIEVLRSRLGQSIGN